MFTFHCGFNKSKFFHWIPSSHGVVQYLPDSKFCLSNKYYQWLNFTIEFRLTIKEQSELYKNENKTM